MLTASRAGFMDLVVAGVVVVTALIQAPRAERRLIQGAPALTPSEARKFPIPELQRLRASAGQVRERPGHAHVLRRALT